MTKIFSCLWMLMTRRIGGTAKQFCVILTTSLIFLFWTNNLIPATYSNLENHPRLIRARQNKPVAKIKLDPKTGFPIVVEPVQESKLAPTPSNNDGIDSGSDTDTCTSIFSFL
jgi:hypothetical protein